VIPPSLLAIAAPEQGRITAARIHRADTRPVVLPLHEEERYVLGRHDAADVVFESQGISRLHAMIRFEGGQWLVEDLGSSNGTAVARRGNGEPVRIPAHQPFTLAASDVVELGEGDARLELLAQTPEDAQRAGGEETQTSRAARQFADKITLAARTRVPVFLLGPSGCGKTHTARQIHNQSQSVGAFVSINCARLPSDANSLHSELLGHVRGAFTGADAARTGKLFHANGGTLFLDEAESLSGTAQGFLLDVLEGTGDLAPLGSRELGVRPPIFRLISASKVPLARSGLRMDLCERLAEGHMWKLPTLDERREDIPGLVRLFSGDQGKMLGITVEVSDEAIHAAQVAPWPGQIRQLRAMVTALAQTAFASAGPGTRKLVIRRTDVDQHLLEREEAFGAGAFSAVTAAPPGDETQNLKLKADARALTKDQVQHALQDAGGNQSVAARRLGIARNTLARRMKDFGIQGADE